MDIRRLHYFLVVAQEGQITRAAKRLNIAQPPLSQQLKLLESELGTRLIERGGSRKIKLTEAGEVLRRRGEQILTLVERTEEEVKDMHDGLRGAISIGVSTSWGAIYLPELIRIFNQLYPEINFHLWDGDTYRIEEYLYNGIIDLALTRVPIDTATFVSVTLPDEPMAAVFSAKWDYGMPSASISLTDLADKPLIIHRRYESVMDCFSEAGLEPRVICTCSDVRTMMAWANAGIGVAIVNRSSALLCRETLTIKEIGEPALRSLPTALVWMRKRYLSTAIRNFIAVSINELNVSGISEGEYSNGC